MLRSTSVFLFLLPMVRLPLNPNCAVKLPGLGSLDQKKDVCLVQLSPKMFLQETVDKGHTGEKVMLHLVFLNLLQK